MRQTDFHPRTGVIALARHQLAELDAAARLPAMPSGVLRATEGFVVSALERRAAQFAELEIWFQGALASLAQARADSPVDPDDTIVSDIDEAETSLLDMRHRVLKQIGLLAVQPSRPRLSAALRAVASSSADLYDVLVRFKWAVIEREGAAGNSDFFEWLGLDTPAAPSAVAGLRAALPALRQRWWQRKAVDIAL